MRLTGLKDRDLISDFISDVGKIVFKYYKAKYNITIAEARRKAIEQALRDIEKMLLLRNIEFNMKLEMYVSFLNTTLDVLRRELNNTDYPLDEEAIKMLLTTIVEIFEEILNL